MFHTEDFIEYLKTVHLSPKTIRAYSALVGRLKSYFIDRGVCDVKEITEERITEYVDLFSDRHGSSKYHYVGVIRLKRYFAFLEERGVIFLSPLKQIPNPKPLSSSYPTLDQKRIRLLLDSIKPNTPFLVRGKAVMELAYSSALRPGEIYNLKITDIDFKEGILFISRSKGEKDRLVPVGNKALRLLAEYIKDVRPKYMNGERHEYVFVSHKTGGPLTVWGLRSAVRETLIRSGLSPFPPYCLRSASATALFLGGMDVAYIGKLLGHVELRTTQRYLSINKQDLKEELFLKHPRNKFLYQGGNR